MQIHVGTSGFSYPAWKGSFYPDDLPAAKWLAFYATQLDTVEINNTFYRMPKESVLAAWADEVPAGFRFVLKAPRQMGSKLGPVLFQLPPNLKKDVARLEGFLRLLPAQARAAFEFRHESWFGDEVYALLREHRAALCLAEDDELATPTVATADWGYLRLRRTAYAPDELGERARRIPGLSWRECYVYFKHEEAGLGPRLAAELRALF